MGKTAFIFPGQGAQCCGMGAGLYKSSEASKRIFELAEAVRSGTMSQCFNGTGYELGRTVNTQPCLFTTELAIAAALIEAGINADMAAGFSLGELSALTYAYMFWNKSVSRESGPTGYSADSDRAENDSDEIFTKMLELVMKRASLMQMASEESHAAMVAVLKLSEADVRKLCSSFEGVYPVNFNCPGQISVAASPDVMGPFSEAVKKAGGRVIPLNVSGGFHSPFMRTAAEGFREAVEESSLSFPEFKVYADLTAAPYSKNAALENGTAYTMTEMLSGQIISPVLWEQIIRNMINDGADTFIEAGPGETLSGMVRRIDKDVRVFSVSDTAGIDRLLNEI